MATPDFQPGVDDVNIIWEGLRTRGALAFKRRPVFSGMGQSWLRLARSRARSARKAPARSVGQARPRKESRRGRYRALSRDAQVLAGGQQAAWEKAATHPPQRRPSDGDVLARAARRNVAYRSDAGPAVDALLQLGVEINVALYDAKLERERRRRILAVGRRGAAATRPFQPTAIPGRRGGDRGVVVAPAPDAKPGTSTSPSRVPGVELPTGSPAVEPGPSPVPASRPVAVPGTLPAPAPSSSPATAPSPLQVRLTNLGQMLEQALMSRPATRAVATVVRPLPTTLQPPLPTTLQAPLGTPGLTAQNSPLLGFSNLVEPEPTPQEDLDKCKCPKTKKRKSDKKRCRNPVVSRSTSGNIRTTKVRLVCPPSKQKLRLL